MPILERVVITYCLIFLQLGVISARPAYASETVPCSANLTFEETIISTVRYLYENGYLTTADIEKIQTGINPLAQRRDSNARVFSQAVDEVIAQMANHSTIKAQLDQFAQTINFDKTQQNNNAVDTEDVFATMHMYEIPGGKLSEWNSPWYLRWNKSKVKGFYAANIPVTQWQYAFVMRGMPFPSPSEFINGPDSQIINIEGRKIRMQPNNPVENVSWDEAQIFLELLNKWSEENNPFIYQIIPNHLPHARVRLLTLLEWQFLIRNRGQWNGLRPPSVTAANLKLYAWYDQNANKVTHPVAELLPIMISGHPFYDLLGNVADLVGSAQGTNLHYCGGSWFSSHNHILQGLNFPTFRPGNTAGFVGLRLAEDPP